MGVKVSLVTYLSFHIFIINKNNKMSNEFKRMQKLAGLITESQLNNDKYPKGFTPIEINKEEDNETYDGEVIAAYEAPMDGWDTEHFDSVVIVKKEDGFYIDGYVSFGDFNVEGPFKTQQEAEDRAYKIMEEFIEDWEEDEDEDY